MSNRVKTLSDNELVRKKKALENYLEDVIAEIKFRRSNGNTIPRNVPDFPQYKSSSELNLSESSNTSDKVKKLKIKKGGEKKKTSSVDDSKNRVKVNKVRSSSSEDDSKPRKIKANVQVLKKILTKNNVPFKSRTSREELCELVRKHYLVRTCEKEADK